MFIRILFIIVIIGCLNRSSAQEGNNWFVSYNIGIDFNCKTSQLYPLIVGYPDKYQDYQIANEGSCTSMSDTSGKLLFFANSISVFNRNGVEMPHGRKALIESGPSYDDPMITIPDPGNGNRYYIFFQQIHSNYISTLSYALVDMSLDNGMGDVLEVKRDIFSNVFDGLTATRAKNKRDFWLATPTYAKPSMDSFNLLHITPSGISIMRKELPVKSNYRNHLMFSSDGRRLSIYVQDSKSKPFFFIFDFDKETGKISHPVPINLKGYYDVAAAAFSPDNSKLYIITFNENIVNPDSANLIQYDISQGNDSSKIALSRTIISRINVFNNGHFTLRLAPNGKIFSKFYDGKFYYLSAIEKPNESGSASKFTRSDLDLNIPYEINPYLRFYSEWTHLPNLITRHPQFMPYDISNYKSCSPIALAPFSNFNSQSFRWDFGDPESGNDNISTQRIGIHTYHHAGRYKVRLYTNNSDSLPDTFTRFICISSPIVPIKDTVVCGEQSITLDGGNPGATYLWYDGDTSRIKSVLPGKRWVRISMEGCELIDTVYVLNIDNIHINLGKDTVLCDGNSIKLKAGYSGAKWSTGEQQSSITVSKAGTYWVTIKGDNCQASDTMNIRTDCNFGPYVPNAFTPDHNNLNEKFRISDPRIIELQLTIFNRWGEKVFESNDIQDGWDGRFKEDEAQTGVYFYLIRYKEVADENSKIIKGMLHLLR